MSIPWQPGSWQGIGKKDQKGRWNKIRIFMKIEMIVERTRTGYSAYAEKYSVYTVGKSLEELKLNKDQPFTVQGPFKYGFYVRDLSQVQAYLHEKKVVIKHEIFEDQDTHSKSLIFQDINGNLVQVLQELNP